MNNYQTFLSTMVAAATICISTSAFADSLAYEDYTQIPLSLKKEEGTLIFSDCPEYADTPGILYEGTVEKGEGRLYYYHVNETGAPARLVVYAKADKKQPLTMKRAIRGDASSSYIPTGSTLSFREAINAKQEEKTFHLAPGERTILFEDDPKGISEEDLVSGIVEIKTKHPVKLGAAILPMGDDKSLQEALDTAAALPPDSHEMRGTFAADIYLSCEPWDFSQGNAEITIGSSYPFQQGKDEVSGVNRENTGDYGIRYHITVKTKGSGNYKLYINPMGGVYMGTFEIGQNEKLLRTYRTDGTLGKAWFGDGTMESCLPAGTWHAGKDLYIRFIPAGAAYLPLRFLLVAGD